MTGRTAPCRPVEPDPVIDVYKASVDRTLLRERLRRTPSERLDDLRELARFADALQEAGRRLRDRV